MSGSEAAGAALALLWVTAGLPVALWCQRLLRSHRWQSLEAQLAVDMAALFLWPLALLGLGLYVLARWWTSRVRLPRAVARRRAR